jgi:hypothetical protein
MLNEQLQVAFLLFTDVVVALCKSKIVKCFEACGSTVCNICYYLSQMLNEVMKLRGRKLKMKQEVLGRTNCLLSFDTTRTA